MRRRAEKVLCLGSRRRRELLEKMPGASGRRKRNRLNRGIGQRKCDLGARVSVSLGVVGSDFLNEGHDTLQQVFEQERTVRGS